MKVDGGIGADLSKAGAEARELEEAGYSGIWTAETSHDPFFPLLLAAQQTRIPYVVTFHSGGPSSTMRNVLRPVQQTLLRPLLSRNARPGGRTRSGDAWA